MTTPEMITALDEIIAATQTMGGEYGHPRVASIAEDIKRTLLESRQQAQADFDLLFTVVWQQIADSSTACSPACYKVRLKMWEKIEAAIHSPESPQAFEAPAEAPHEDPAASDAAAATGPPERHIDTPDELLELLAGISSLPQIEGLSLAQKASTMALLYTAKALQRIEEMQRTAFSETPITRLNPHHRYSRRRHYRVDHEEYPQEPPADAPSFDALAGEHTAAWESWAQELPGLARKFAWMLINASNRAGMPAPPVQSPSSPQDPS
jgi:hypothetical protein